MGVLPEIIDIAMIQRPHRDAVGGVKHLQDGIVIAPIARIGLQHRQRRLVLRFHPGQGFRAMHIFQPGIRIGMHVRLGHGGCSGGAKEEDDKTQAQAHG
jgi:hypothetical protein